MAKSIFENPDNGYREEVNSASFFGVLIFGCLYFLIKGAYGHAVISLVLALITFGISNLFYAFGAKSIVEKTYLRKGWVKVT